MRLLVIHQNFPGQFGHLVRAWAQRPGWDVRALSSDTAPGLPGFNGLLRYSVARKPQRTQHPYLRQMEAATLHGQATARAMLKLRQSGFTPDAILAHPGWGETLYAKDVFPDAKLVHFCEWFYSAEGADLGFDPEFSLSFDDRARIRTWNALHTLNLTNCDAAVTPTRWQWSRHPEIFRPKITIQHEGIATHELGPDPNAEIVTPNGTLLKAGDPVITYVARNLEPYRGFHVFMRALERIQRADSRCHALIVGGDEVSYGRKPADAANWRERMLREVRLDPQRTHFLGRVPREHYLRVLRVSAAHVYLSYPFVLSWSLLEAMACGLPLVASNTAPVREVMRDGIEGRLVDFFCPDPIANAVCGLLADGRAALALRHGARRVAQQYSFEAGQAGYERLTLGLTLAVGAPSRNNTGTALTAAERELLALLARGHSTEAIARSRQRSPATVRNQLSVLYQKLEVSRRAEAIVKAAAMGLLDSGMTAQQGVVVTP
ncbi:MAG TPA: glycosyltransferase [Methylibium sp.]|uniref:glycosyltransferase n=1 Tax=Methylibium sp. TaxID=2067992 RepID=UPI002DB86EFC|nr:glycosyltransferase [Methylibium sp.]HEU4459750.1 glycosyltransferase [Methylibium sp.]